jgi:Rap1a immunity proteins
MCENKNAKWECALSSKVIIYIAAIVALTMACLPRASADGADGVWQNGNQLLDACTDQTGHENTPLCYGYIQGIIDMSWYMTGYLKLKGDFCIPQEVTVRQLSEIVAKYLRDNPSTRRYRASVLVHIALFQAFPCPKD